MKNFLAALPLITLILLSTGVFAWVEPQDGQNIAAPINTGSQAQTKQGQLNVQGGINISGNTVLSNGNNGIVTIGGKNNTGEGAEIQMQGTGGYDGFILDNYQGNPRLFSNDSNDHTFQIFNLGSGKSNLSVENNLSVEGLINTPNLCLAGNCRNSWPKEFNFWWEWHSYNLYDCYNSVCGAYGQYEIKTSAPNGSSAILGTLYTGTLWGNCTCYVEGGHTVY